MTSGSQWLHREAKLPLGRPTRGGTRRASAEGAIVKASLFRFTLHAVDADDIPWVRVITCASTGELGP